MMAAAALDGFLCGKEAVSEEKEGKFFWYGYIRSTITFFRVCSILTGIRKEPDCATPLPTKKFTTEDAEERRGRKIKK